MLISHTSKVMLKILQARLQQYISHELPDVQGELKNAEEAEIKLPTSVGSSKNQESSRKTSISAVLTMPKPLTVYLTTNRKILKEMGRIHRRTIQKKVLMTQITMMMWSFT